MSEVKICRECRWCFVERPTWWQKRFDNQKERWWCEHPTTRDIITGSGRNLCENMRRTHIPERCGFIISLPEQKEGPCGPDGQLWEKRNA